MQNRVVMAFRKRCKNRGYREISIRYDKEKKSYLVLAVDPLAGIPVSCYFTIEAMHYKFR